MGATKKESKGAICNGKIRQQSSHHHRSSTRDGCHARKFAEEGAKVVVTDINETAGKALVEEIGENAVFMKLDVSKSANWEEVIALTEEKFGPVTVLVNNAGVGIFKTLD